MTHAAPPPARPVIEFDGVSFAFGETPVLEDVSLRIPERTFACVVGPNGGGKSTLLKLALGLLRPARGGVRLLGAAPTETRARVGYMPQHAQLDPQFPVTVLDVVLMGRLRGIAPLGSFGAADRRAAREALAQVDLADFERRSFVALSGGQRQRVLIARALSCDPEVLLLDEPTANLDMEVEKQLYALLAQIARRRTVIIVSHDVGFVSQYVEMVVCVNRRVEVHDTQAITGEVIGDLYGRAMRMVAHGHHHHHH